MWLIWSRHISRRIVVTHIQKQFSLGWGGGSCKPDFQIIKDHAPPHPPPGELNFSGRTLDLRVPNYPNCPSFITMKWFVTSFHMTLKILHWTERMNSSPRSQRSQPCTPWTKFKWFWHLRQLQRILIWGLNGSLWEKIFWMM